MKKGALWGLVSLLIVSSMVLASCSSSTTTATATTTTISPTTTTATTAVVSTTTSTTSAPVTVMASPPVQGTGGHTGVPQYGGTMTINNTVNPGLSDPNGGSIQSSLEFLYMDSLFGSNSTANPSVQNYQLSYYDENYVTGDLASVGNYVPRRPDNSYSSWGLLAKPTAVNGRQLNSGDVLFHMNRMAGLGSGYTAPNSYFVSDARVAAIKTVTAPDNWTVVMTFSTLNPEFILENMKLWVATAQSRTPRLYRHIPRRPTRNSLTGIMPSAPDHLY